MTRLNSRGFGLVELCIAMLILAMFAETVAVARLVGARKTVALLDQGFAKMKALQMMEELKAQANRVPIYGALLLDYFNDGEQANSILTTDKEVDKPGGNAGDPLSGNRLTNGHWRYLRKIQVSPVESDLTARRVVIKIWKFASDSDPLVPGLLLATKEETVKAYSP